MALRFSAAMPASLDQLRHEPRPQRIRVHRDSHLVADTTDAYLVWEPRRVVPMYALPWDDFRATISQGSASTPDLAALPQVLGPENFGAHTSPGHLVGVQVGGQQVEGAAYVFDDPDLGNRVLLDFWEFTWLEEADEVIGHPHDPFKRIDVLRTSRRVQVAIDGQVLAESDNAFMLLETHLPPRWYFPRSDVRLDLMAPSEAHTICAYKGHASYFSYEPSGFEGSDLAWTYADPLHDALRVKDHIAFYNERVDLTIDGVLGERPVTPWSRPW